MRYFENKNSYNWCLRKWQEGRMCEWKNYQEKNGLESVYLFEKCVWGYYINRGGSWWIWFGMEGIYWVRTAKSDTASNKKMYVSARVYRGKLILSCSDAGTTTVTFRLYGKEFQIQLKVSVVEISDTSVLRVRHKTKKLKIKGYSGKIQRRSSRPKVASVFGKGKVREKRKGILLSVQRSETFVWAV